MTPPSAIGPAAAGFEGYFKFNPIPPIWRELQRYSWTKFKSDAIAGLMVAIVTIPQAIGFAVVVGLPVQAVVATAIVGAVACAMFSTSHHLVFGPTNTSAIILAGALVALANVPMSPLSKVLLIGFLMGVVQVAAGFFKLGSLTQFISRTVIIAYTTAVGVLIGTGQISNLLGLGRAPSISLVGTLAYVVEHLSRWDINLATAGVGLMSLLIMILIQRWRPRWPHGLIVLGLAGLGGYFGHLGEFGVRLVRDAGELSGGVPIFSGFPLNAEGLRLVPEVASIAIAAAILGMLEVVSVTKGIAVQSGQKIDPNQEMVAMGFGNLASSVFGAMPGSSSFVRSAVCFQSGGRTQVAALLCSGIILLVLAATAAMVNFIPIAALAAFLILIAAKLINLSMIRIARKATLSDAIVFWVTLGAALLLQLDTAIYVGIAVSVVLFLRKAAAPSLVEYTINDDGQFSQRESGQDRNHPSVAIVHVEGELFFGAADLFQEQVRLQVEAEQLRVVILRMKNARHLDATSVLSLLQLKDFMLKTDRDLIISGITDEVEKVLKQSGAWERIGDENIFPAEANLTMSTKRALMRARAVLKAKGVAESPDLRFFYDPKKDTVAKSPGGS